MVSISIIVASRFTNHNIILVDIDEEIDANQKQRETYASDSTDDEDDGKPRVREVRTPMKPHDNNNKTPVKKKWVIQKKPAQSPHVGIPPSPQDS